MVLSSTCCELQPGTNSFDLWLRIKSIGKRQEILIPTKRTKHYLKWKALGAEATTLTITSDCVIVSFEVQTGPKLEPTEAIGVDTGIEALATCSDGSIEGTNIKSILESMDRKKKNSKAWQREKRHLKHVIATAARAVVAKAPVIVVEKLKGITHKTKSPKRRLGLKLRRWIGQWNVMYWLSRIQAVCEENRVSFRTVPAYNTSVICSDCGFSDPGNRPSQSVFNCLECGFKANADFNASINIVRRFTSGPYGAGCKVKSGSFLPD
jgi:transposase